MNSYITWVCVKWETLVLMATAPFFGGVAFAVVYF